MEINPTHILEIGSGNRLVADILEKIGYSIKVMDNDSSLYPEYIMDIRDEAILNLKNEFDLIIASQVLEHINYEEFLKVLSNIIKITKTLVISLPYTDINAHFFFIHLTFSYFKKGYVDRKFGTKFYFNKKPHLDTQKHKWEIGKKNFSLRRVKKDIKKCGWYIQKTFFNQNKPYHYFFVLTNKKYINK